WVAGRQGRSQPVRRSPPRPGCVPRALSRQRQGSRPRPAIWPGAVGQQGSIANPKNKAVLAGYGRALADNGNFQQALDVLSQAHTPEDPDWRILSAQGAVLDQLGRYAE